MQIHGRRENLIEMTKFVSGAIWPQITKSLYTAKGKGYVAVAYFGAGAARLLPLRQGSRLVVDASERAVASGQTCPSDLLRLVKRGVTVYSVPNLHAKVFVAGRVAFIGSVNVSNRSASHLIEAVVRSTSRTVVRAARKFVADHCLHELTPKVLERLGKLYCPPPFIGGKSGRKATRGSARRPALPRVFLAPISHEDWSDEEQHIHDQSLAFVEKRYPLRQRFRFDSFRAWGSCPYRQGDLVVQVVEERDGRFFVETPGEVLYVRTCRDRRQHFSFVYFQCRIRRRRPLKALAKAMGRGALKRLHRDALIRGTRFAQRLLEILAK